MDLVDQLVGVERLEIRDLQLEEVGLALQFLFADLAHLHVRIGRTEQLHPAQHGSEHGLDGVGLRRAAWRQFGISVEQHLGAGRRIGEHEFRRLGAGAAEADRELAVLLQVIALGVDEEAADHRDIRRPGQCAQFDAGGLDLAETGIEISQRVDGAPLHGDAGGDAFTDREPLHVLVRVHAEIGDHGARHRIVGGTETRNADLLALEIVVTLDRRIRRHGHVPLVGIGVFVERDDRRQFALGIEREREARCADAELQVALVEADLHGGDGAERHRIDREAFLLVVAERLADHHVDGRGVHRFGAHAEPQLRHGLRMREARLRCGDGRGHGAERGHDLAAVEASRIGHCNPPVRCDVRLLPSCGGLTIICADPTSG